MVRQFASAVQVSRIKEGARRQADENLRPIAPMIHVNVPLS
jgi:hypothetical protein